MKTLKLLWDLAGVLASLVLVCLWAYKGFTADDPVASVTYFIGMFVVLIHHQVTKDKA